MKDKKTVSKDCLLVNRERLLALNKKYNDSHKEERRAYYETYKLTHAKEIKGRRKKYQTEHAEELNVKGRAYYAANGEMVRAKERTYKLKRKYGMTHEEFNSLFKIQGERCATCLGTNWAGRLPHIDHDHETGKIRGILCPKCNLALGLVDDNSETLKRMIIYLEKK